MTRHAPTADAAAVLLEQLLGAVGNLNDTMGQLRTGMKTRDAVRVVGTDPRYVVTAGGPGNPGLVSSGSAGLVAGVNFRETQGVATVVRVLDGTDAGGSLLWVGSIPANGTISAWFLPGGISHTNGIFVQVTGGGVEGLIYKDGAYLISKGQR